MWWLLLACAGKSADSAGDSPGIVWSYPMDDVLTFADLQALGTHNSYHIETEGNTLVDWDYTMAPLDVQLGEQGVRQFELDFYHEEGVFSVMHIPVLDQETTCATMAACLAVLDAWSSRNPAHHPVFVMIEPKASFNSAEGPATLDALDAELRAGLGDRLVTPDEVQGGAATLRDAVETQGWPKLEALRGRYVFMLHDGGEWRDAYTDGDTTTAGRAMFPDGQSELDLPISAVHAMNDPIGSADTIAEAVGRNHLVRTMGDGDRDAVLANDTSRAEAAFASGAHFISTDYPTPFPDSGYVVAVPGGTPSRCHPLRPVDGCASEMIEDPSFIRP